MGDSFKVGEKVLVPGVIAPVTGWYNSEWSRVKIMVDTDPRYFDILNSELVKVPKRLPTVVGSIVGRTDPNTGRHYEYTLRSENHWIHLHSELEGSHYNNDYFQKIVDWYVVWDRGSAGNE